MFLCAELLGAGESEFIDGVGQPLREVSSENGTVKLAWRTEKVGAAVIVEQSDRPDFSLAVERYRGDDAGSVLTGLPEGVHYFRLAEEGTSDWSSTLVATVTFFDPDALTLLLTIGAFVVLATVGTIVGGHMITTRRSVSGVTETEEL